MTNRVIPAKAGISGPEAWARLRGASARVTTS